MRFLNLNLQTDGEGQLAISTDGQIYGHPAAVDAFSVAAVSAQGHTTLFTTAERIETFSSDGPRCCKFYAHDWDLNKKREQIKV